MQHLALAQPGHFWLWTSALILLSIAAFSAAFWLLQRARLIEDTPTSRLRSAAQGYVQVEGNARWMPGPDIISPLSRQRCVWWRYSIEERVTRGNREEWMTIESGESSDLFLLIDPTGECIIDPEGAEVQPSIERSWRGFSTYPTDIPKRSPWFSMGQYRYREKLIVVGERLFATGWFRTQSAHTEFDDAQEVRELLAEWKRDRHELLRRFDTNKDGQIDVQEWEAARRAALEQVRAAQLERSTDPDLNVLSEPPTRLPFVLAAAPKHAVARRLKWIAGAGLLASTVGAGWAVRLLQGHGVL
jgi:hypothetical protein